MAPDPSAVPFTPSPACVRMVEANRRRFDWLVAHALRPAAADRQALRCAHAAIFATLHPCGTVYSAALEGVLQRLAATLPPAAPVAVDPKRTLHVFTRAYATGGHTRVAERWIDASPGDERHDVVLTGQGTRPIPPHLRDAAANKNGELFNLSEGLPMARAAALRRLAAGYRCVILHVHPYDTVAMIAFGAHFARPVIFYNHADHIFWLGASVADLVVNFRRSTHDFNAAARNLHAQATLPMPVPALRTATGPADDAVQIKASLSFAADSRLVVTVAAPYKFRPFGGLDFAATALEILRRSPNAVLLAIGPDERDPYWAQARAKSGGRLRAIGMVAPDALDRYLRVASLAVESFPLGSSMALFEIAKHGVPCLALHTPTNRIDQYEEAGILCNDPASLVERATAALAAPHASGGDFSALLERDCLPPAFGRHLAALAARFPHAHAPRPAAETAPRQVTQFEWFTAENFLAQRTPGKRAREAVRRAIGWAARRGPMPLNRWAYARLNGYGLL